VQPAFDARGGKRFVGVHAIDRVETPLADVHGARTHRCADPFVQVEPDEVGAEGVHAEWHLSEGVRCIHHHVGPTRLGERGDLVYWDDQAGLVVAVREQQELRARVRLERPAIRLEDVFACGRLGDRQRCHLRTA